MELTRREFVAALAAGGAWLGMGLDAKAASTGQARGIVVGFGKGHAPGTGQPLFVGAIADLDERSIGLVDLDFFGHGFAPHPIEKHRAVVFEKRGPGCCEIDLRERKVLRRIPAPAGRHFYGHGAFSPDGATLYVAETNLESHEGRIAVLDGKTLSERGTFPTYGANPHECLLLDGGSTLVITNGGDAKAGSPGSVTFVDAKSEKLLERLPIPDDRFNAGHVAVSGRGDLVAISAPRDGLPLEAPGGVSIRPAPGPATKGRFGAMVQPKDLTERLIGEALSVALHEGRRLAAVTHPDANLVTIWDVAGMKLVKSLSLPAPRGLTRTLDGEHLVVSHSGGKLSMLPWSTLEVGEPLPLGQTPFGGSHLYTLRSIG